jgi:hypothetical protein
VQLQVVPATSPAGSTAAIPLSLNSDSAVTAFQVDLLLSSPAVTLLAATPAGNLTTHAADVALIAPGVYRVITYSVFNAPIPNGTVLTLAAAISPLASNGPVSITLTNALVSTPSALALANVTLSPGTLTIGAAAANIHLSNLAIAGGQFQFQVSGVTGSSFVVESSTDLKTWTTLTTQPVSGPVNPVSTPAPLTNKRQFFRVRAQ